jgi:hypothetical protein
MDNNALTIQMLMRIVAELNSGLNAEMRCQNACKMIADCVTELTHNDVACQLIIDGGEA